MTFSQKKLRATLQLANGQFDGGGNTATIDGLRMSAQIHVVGGPEQSSLNLAIWGLPLSLMNQMSMVGNQLNKMYENNMISIEAGDAETGMTLVFVGRIFKAYVDAQAMPQVCFRIQATPGGYWAVKPAKPLSIQGSADAAGMMKDIAGQMGLTFENAGVVAKLSNPYYGGSLWTQMLSIARHAGFDVIIERGVMAIIPPGKTRKSDKVVISPETGMVGYPAFNEAGVLVRALFNPAVKFGAEVEIQSDLTPACGAWKVIRLDYELECMKPHGRWFMAMELGPTGRETTP